MPSKARSEEKIRFTILVNLFDFLKPFKGNTYMPAFLQTFFSIGIFWCYSLTLTGKKGI